MAHLNEIQTAKVIIQAMMHGPTTAYTLQQVHKETALALEYQEMEEERQAQQAFVEAFRVTIGTCLPENQEGLLYPL